MSPNVGNFVHDLVEMAKAMETLPQVQEDNNRLNNELNEALRVVQARELAIVRYKQDIEELNTKVRSLEVERDDASFRVMEAEDKAHHVLNWVRDTQALMGQVIGELDPPKPEPVKEPEPQELTASGHNPNIEPVPEAVHSISELPGQSESSPTNSAIEPVTSASSSNVANSDAGNIAEPTHGPYFGKLYRDVSGYVSYHDWVEGGGTYEDYYINRSSY